MDDALRTRLEGRLEVLEETTRAYEQLERALRLGWELHVTDVVDGLAAAQRVAPQLEEALAAAARIPEAADASRRLAHARDRLERRLRRKLAAPKLGSGSTLEERLAAWHELARHTAWRPREGEALAEAVHESSPWSASLVGVVIVATAFLLRALEGWLALALVAVSLVTARLTRRRTKYRLFDDALEVQRDDGQPARLIPLGGVTLERSRQGTVVRGLWNAELPDTSSFTGLVDLLSAVVESREAIAREETLLAKYPAEPGLWLAATLAHHDAHTTTEHVGQLDIVHFDGATRPARGWALVTASGVLFFTHDAERAVRIAATGCRPYTFMKTQQRAQSALPEQPFLEKLDALRAIPGVKWLDAGGVQAWVEEARHDVVRAGEERLALVVDEATRARVRAVRGVG